MTKPVWQALLAEQVDDYYKRRKADRRNKLFHKSARRASRFFLDTSDSSMDLGNRSTRAIARADANLRPGVPGEMVEVSQAFGFLGLAISILYTLMIPALYFYYKVSGEPVPFTVTNNVRWAVSASAVALSIVGMLIPPAALGICFAGATIALIVNLIGIAKIIRTRVNSTNMLVEAEDRIFALTAEIENTKDAYHIKQEEFKALSDDEKEKQFTTFDDELKKLAKDFSQVTARLNKTKHAYRELQVTFGYIKADEKRKYRATGASHANLQLTTASLKVLVACLLLIGLGLTINPVTWPIGVAILITGAVLGFSMYLVGKAHEVTIHKQQKALKHTEGDSVKNKNELDLTKKNIVAVSVKTDEIQEAVQNTSRNDLVPSEPDCSPTMKPGARK